MSEMEELERAAREHVSMPLLERPMHNAERTGAEWVIIIAAGIFLGSMAVQLVDWIILDHLVEHILREIRAGL